MTRRAPLAADRLDDRIVPAWGLDSTFGTGGTAVLANTADGTFQATTSLPTSDGGVIVAGTLTPTGGTAQLAVLRLTPSGAPDTSFNAGKPLAVPSSVVNDPNSVRLTAAGGKYLLAANTPNPDGGGSEVLVVRLNANGAVDGQFGVNGGVILAADLDSTPQFAADVRSLPDGRTAVLTTVGGDVAVTMLNTSGAVDTTFGISGLVRLNLGTTDGNDSAAGLAVQSASGGYKLIVAGTAAGKITAARLTSNGSVDNSFGTNSRATVADTTNRAATAADVAVDDSGRVVLLGRTVGSVAGIPGTAVPSEVVVARFTPDGQADTAFGTAGMTSVAFAGVSESIPADLTVLSNGGLVLTGSARTAELRSGDVFAANDFAVARLTAAGQPDETFGTNGQVVVGFDSSGVKTNDRALAAAVQADGDVVLVGVTSDPLGGTSRVAVARLSEQAVSPPPTTPPTVPPTSPPASPPTSPPTSPPPPASPPVTVQAPTYTPPEGERPFLDYPLGTTRQTSAGDVTGDGIADYVYSTGGGAARIKIVDGASGKTTLGDFSPYERSFAGGINAQLGDLDGDGRSEIIVAPDRGGSARVQVYKWTNGGLQRVANFFAVEDANYRGGATVAVGDINADGRADLLVGAADGGGPRVALFDGKELSGGKVTKLVNDFFGLPDTNFRGGVSLAAADFDGDGKAEIAVGAGAGGAARVRVLSAAMVLAGTPDDGVIRDFFVNDDTTTRNGVTLSTKVGSNGQVDLVTETGNSTRTFAGAGGNGVLFRSNRSRR